MQSTPSQPASSDSSIIRAGSDGRLRFTPAQRQELLDAFDRSGQSAMAFARGHGVCYQTFIAWQRKRRERPALPTTHSGPAFAPTNFPKIDLPFSAGRATLRLEKMAYNLTARASGKSAMRPKNRAWGFSRNGRALPLENRRRCPKPRRKSRPTPTIFTPGIPQWPSRDPLGESGGVNLYGFVGNDGVDRLDNLGLMKKGPCFFRVCIKVDKSAYDWLSIGNSNSPFLNYIVNYTKYENLIKTAFQKQTDACRKSEDCCCSTLDLSFWGPKDDHRKLSAEIEDNLDMGFKDSEHDPKTGGGKRRENQAADTFFGKENHMGYDDDCSILVLLTTQTILTPKSSGEGKVGGLTIGRDGVKNDCGQRAIILKLAENIGDTFSHEVGHFIGWWATEKPMKTPAGLDYSHSEDPTNIMSYSNNLNKMADSMWCSLFCNCAKKMNEKQK